jgi:hypothetical protein
MCASYLTCVQTETLATQTSSRNALNLHAGVWFPSWAASSVRPIKSMHAP